MNEILFNCFNLFSVCLILIIGFLLYVLNKKSGPYDPIKEKEIIESIPRRTEECPQQYLNGWLPVLDSRELKKGEVKSIFSLGRDLVIYRGTSGKVYVFDAYCPHLGANLGVGGTVVGDDIKCHFHGWQFNNQGDCKAIPGLEDKLIPKANIKKWRCDEVNHYIYVWHHLDGIDPDWFIPKSDELERLIYRGRYFKHVYTHFQDVVENEADWVHFTTVHLAAIPKLLKYFVDVVSIDTDWKAVDPPDTHCAVTVIKLVVKLGFLRLEPISFTFTQYGPGSVIGDIQLNNKINVQLSLTLQFQTLGHTKQMLYFKWYSEPSLSGLILAKILLKSMGLFIDPDFAIWNAKRFYRSPTFTKLDEPLIRLRRFYKQFYSDNSKVN